MHQKFCHQQKIKISLILFLGLFFSLFLSRCGHFHSDQKSNHDEESVHHANAYIEPKSNDKTIKGKVHFMNEDGVLTATAKIEGLKPNSLHGFHIHEVGDCSAPDATSAGGHFSPNKENKHSSHTDPNRHAGDLGNLKSDQFGKAELKLPLPGLNLSAKDKTFSVFERAVIIHADPDDFVTQPTGNSGARIGCGVIKTATHH